LIKALQVSFPETNWKTWNFESVSKGFWNTIENQRSFFLQLEKQLNIKNFEDWYNISVQQVNKLGASGLLYLQHADLSMLTRLETHTTKGR
jgi:hypothetical protein